MSTQEIVTLAAALVTVIAAVGAAIVSVITALRVAPLATKVDAAVTQVGVVHELVNGLSEKKDAAIDSSARAQGELAGRDFTASTGQEAHAAGVSRGLTETAALMSLIESEVQRRVLLATTVTPIPVVIAASDVTVPVQIEEAKKP